MLHFARAGLSCLAILAAIPGSHAQPADGLELFKHNWASAQGGNSRLGPLFNEASCHACHWFGGGARLRIRPNGEVAAAGVLVRLGDGAGKGHGQLGFQLQNKAVDGAEAEGAPDIRAMETGTGLTRFVTSLRLNRPVVEPLHHSLRAAPALDVSARIEKVSAKAVLALADVGDKDGDGISGRPALLIVPGAKPVLGKFGWKANQPSLSGQISAALSADMGLSTSERPAPFGDCTGQQVRCRKLAGSANAGPDVSDAQVSALSDYLVSLAPPDAGVKLPSVAKPFKAVGCAACHVPKPDGKTVLFSDLLLHDMGEGLSATAAEGAANAQEWRTTPLIGFRGRIRGHRYLHDGRAASIDEAIRWHGGEAETARRAYEAMAEDERKVLLDYVQGLLGALDVPRELAGN